MVSLTELKRKIHEPTQQQTNKKKKAESIHELLNTIEYESWTREQVCSLLVAQENGCVGLTVEKVKPLYDVYFDGAFIANIVTTVKDKGMYFAIDRLATKYPTINPETLETVVNWVENKLPKLKDPKTLFKIELRSFDISAYINEELEKLEDVFKNSMKEWSDSIQKTVKIQKSKLGRLYKRVFLPDHHDGFNNTMMSNWTNHFNELRIPKEKGKELSDLLYSNLTVGRGDDFCNSIITFIDLSTSGKTYTIFQLANQEPPLNSSNKSLFVINLLDGKSFFSQFLKYVDQEQGFQTLHSPLHLVSLLAYTVNICVKTLIDRIPTVTPIQFLKFIRNDGDLFLKEILIKLVKADDPDMGKLEDINKDITKELSEKGVKVVFSFDEAHILLRHAKNQVLVDGELKGSLFHAIYQQIRKFNNPVFLGNTFTISNALLNVSKEGRKLVVPIVGSLQPWFLKDVETVLSTMFSIHDIKKKYEEEVDMMCYLLSGSPENFAMFHRVLLSTTYNYSRKTIEKKLEMLTNAVGEVVGNNKSRSESRLKDFLNDTKLMDRKTHLLRLLFKKECVFQNIEITDLEKLIDFQYSYSQAFIEKTIAFVVKESKSSQKVFDIVDPIVAKTYFESAFNLMIDEMWKFMSENFYGNGEEFEFFIIMLLIHEGKLLDGENFTKSPLFKQATNMQLTKWYLNTTSFLSDRNLSLEQSKNIPGMWLTQLANNHFRECFIRPCQDMDLDGFFYLKHEDNFQLVRCAMTLMKDPVSDENQPGKINRMLETLSLHNIGQNRSGNDDTLNYSIPQNLQNTSTIGWIVAPNMDTKIFTSKAQNLIVSDRKAINECLDQYKSQSYYNDMICVWNKFL